MSGKFGIEDIREIMQNPTQIRNMSVIAQYLCSTFSLNLLF
jgi:hypothetical protein